MSRKLRPVCQINYVLSTGPQFPIISWDQLPITVYIENIISLINLTRNYLMYIIIFTFMGRNKPTQPEDIKIQALRAQGALHLHPGLVQVELFQSHEFFDAHDMVQVKYEMLRRHRVDGKSVVDVVASFGTNRQTFYLTESAFKARGLSGLIRQRRGPKQAHKCTDALLNFVESWRSKHPSAGQEKLLEQIQKKFNVTLHPRSIDRALLRQKKKRKNLHRKHP